MALPIASSCLMALGIQVTGKLADVTDLAADKLFGKTASHVLEEVHSRLRAYSGTVPPNHDLGKAIRLAELTSSLMVLEDYRIREEAERLDERAAQAPPFIAAARRWLHHQIGLCPGFQLMEDAGLVRSLEQALDEMLCSEAPAAAARRKVAAAEQAVWDALLAGAAAAEPPLEFADRFFGRVPELPGWSACFLAFIREALKDKPRVQVAYFVSRLAVLREDSAKLAAVLDALCGDIRAMRSQLVRVEAGGERIEANTERLLEGQAAQQAMLQALLTRVAEEKGVPAATLRAVLARFGEEGVAEEAIPARLMAKAEEYLSLRADLARLSNDRPDAAAARAEAVRRLDAGDFAGARAVLADGRARLRALREQTSREEAGLLAEEARVARLELRYRDAAAMLQEAAGLVGFDREEAWKHSLAAADALLSQGDEFGDNSALDEAITAYGRTLDLAPRDQAPLDWAETQNNLGLVLLRLGERDGGTARLEEAVTAFRAALMERKRDRVPLDWAMTQSNLGGALCRLGERESGTARLEEAVTAFRAALEEETRERVPLNWATVQNNLGLTLTMLGQRESGTARLEEAVTAFRAALMERKRDRVPLRWATTQNNFGLTLTMLGQRESGTARLEEAVAAFRAALEEYTRDRVPLNWAMAQNNLGFALTILGERESGVARLEDAVATFRAALEEWRHDRVPLSWAGAMDNLGFALLRLGEREESAARLEEAVAAFRAALEERTRDRVPLDWAQTMENLASAEEVMGDKTGEASYWQSALAGCKAALEEYRRAGAAYYIEKATALRDRLRGKLNPSSPTARPPTSQGMMGS